MDSTTAPPGALPPSPWQRFAAASVRAFHAYANWLVGISWKRFFLLALLLMIGLAILQDLPPFSWRISETIEYVTPKPRAAGQGAAKPAVARRQPATTTSRSTSNGVRIRPGAARGGRAPLRARPRAPPPAPAVADRRHRGAAALDHDRPAAGRRRRDEIAGDRGRAPGAGGSRADAKEAAREAARKPPRGRPAPAHAHPRDAPRRP